MSVEWKKTDTLIGYAPAVSYMEKRVQDIYEGKSGDCVWLLEHSPMYTAGTSAGDSELLTRELLPIYPSGRGGKYTYHGPGQRVAYVMMDLKRKYERPDLKHYVFTLEEWVIRALLLLGIKAERRKGRVGIWVAAGAQMPIAGSNSPNFGVANRCSEADGRADMPNAVKGLPGREMKIAAIGVRVRRWVAYHGVAINLNCDLSCYQGIIPCGLEEYGVTSVHALGMNHIGMGDLDKALKRAFTEIFLQPSSTVIPG